MTPEEALHKMMRHNNDEKPEKLDLRAIILGIVMCLLCFVQYVVCVFILRKNKFRV